MTFDPGLSAHLAGGVTTVARAFAVIRRDGVELGFTDHDRDLSFEGVYFRADAGITAKAVSQTTGLSVDNSELFGALRSDAITEADLLAGRFDDAEVRAWLVNWADVTQRTLTFRGRIGEVVRSAGSFRAEVRGLSEALNKPVGRIYHGRCSAVLGDATCRFDMAQPGFRFELPLDAVSRGRVFDFAAFPAVADRWFEKGRVTVLNGVAAGLIGVVKNDRLGAGGSRRIELWQALGLAPQAGDILRIEAGCDKRAETCKIKFANLLNFQGFPHVPGEDWLMSYPTAGSLNDGGSLQS